MRVAVDYTAAVRQGAGIGRYTRNLFRALAELDAATQYTLFVCGGWGQGDGLGAWPSNFRVRSIPLTDRVMNILWQRIRVPMPIQAFTGAIDLFHSPDFVLPPAGRTPALLTVHDLSFLRVPQCFVPGFRDYLEGAVSRGVARATHVLADSESTKRDLIELMGVSEDKITVVYPGVETRFMPVTDFQERARVAATYGLPERFILGLGTLQPRKNFEGLIDAFHDLLTGAQDRRDTEDLHLVICGGEGWLCNTIQERVGRYNLDHRVHFPGYVRDEDLPVLYSLASVFAFPSWYEGFGLPVLEAMACGTPVVAADNSSLPEVVGNAGLSVRAGDPRQLSESLLQAITDSRLRARLHDAGRVQASRFTWERAAEALLDTYLRFA